MDFALRRRRPVLEEEDEFQKAWRAEVFHYAQEPPPLPSANWYRKSCPTKFISPILPLAEPCAGS